MRVNEFKYLRSAIKSYRQNTRGEEEGAGRVG